MCGIIAYLGGKDVIPILIEGLKRLEYRGYDSAGVAVVQHEKKGINGQKIQVTKKTGKVSNLESACTNLLSTSSWGIAHTRWATHGAPSDMNSHPHTNGSGDIAVVHNGIIENYESLKEQLIEKGYVFQSETDTEVLAHLIDNILATVQCETLMEAVRLALTQVEGAYGIAVVCTRFPAVLVGARKGSPLIVGVGTDTKEFFMASDASAMIAHTNNVIELEDGDIVELSRDKGHRVLNNRMGTQEVPREIKQLSMKREEIEKGGYKHFMLKEVFDQPRVLKECIRGRIQLKENNIVMGGVEMVKDKLTNAKRIILAACGTSWHACLVGEYLIEHFARIPVEVEYASEFRYKNPILNPESDVLMVISQSGETADTLAAIHEANKRGVLTFGIVNTVGSTISRETKAGVYLHAGPEIGVASTKAFTAQVMVLAMIALKIAKERNTISEMELSRHLEALTNIPDQIQTVLDSIPNEVISASKVFRYAQNFLYLGRGFNFPVALEGALKLKEISYIHAEGYPAAEMKHGPIALIDAFMPVVFIAPKVDATYDKIKSNIEEVLARRGSIIVITEEDNHDFDKKAEYVFRVPKTMECFMPLLTVIPQQLLSYYIADMRNLDVDRPRNLAKSVTVE